MVTHHKEQIDAETLIGWASLDLMRVADHDNDGQVSEQRYAPKSRIPLPPPISLDCEAKMAEFPPIFLLLF